MLSPNPQRTAERPRAADRKLSWVATVVLSCVALPAAPAIADVVTDGSTGTFGADSVACAGSIICDGATHRLGEEHATRSGGGTGSNLFIGLSELNVADSETVFFDPRTDVATNRVLVRVNPELLRQLGRDPVSRIDGTLRMDVSGATLLILNSAGVAIGENARLDLSGSVMISTADAIEFADGVILETASSDPIQLTSAAPSEFGFFGEPGAIEVDANQLLLNPTLDEGAPNRFSLVGNSVAVEGAGTSRLIRAPGGRIEFAAVPNDSVIPYAVADIPDSILEGVGADSAVVDLRGADAPIFLNLDVRSPLGADETAGTIVIRGGRIEMLNTALDAPNRTSVSAPVGSGIDLRAGSIRIDGGGLVAGSRGDGGPSNIQIHTRDLHLTGGTFLLGESRGLGTGGSISVAGFDGRERADRLRLDSGARIETVARSEGTGGSISIDADEVEMSGVSTLTATTLATGVNAGGGGAVAVRTNRVAMEGGAQIFVSTLGDGAAGSIDIEADQSVRLSGTGVRGGDLVPTSLASNSGELEAVAASGAGGTIRVQSPSLHVLNGATIQSRSLGSGVSGDLTFVGLEHLRVEGGADGDAAILSRAFDGPGTNGSIAIEADRVDLRNGGFISASTLGSGDAGTLSVRANQVHIDGERSGLLSTTTSPSTGTGRGGLIEVIGAARVSIRNGGVIAASSTSFGDAGDIRLTEIARLELQNGAEIRTRSERTLGGEVELDVRDAITLSEASQITTQVASGTGSGGNIDLRTRVLGLEESRVSANAVEGNGGDIAIEARLLTQAGAAPGGGVSPITASSTLGINGVISIATPEADLVGSLSPLASERLIEAPLRATPCDVPVPGSQRSRLMIDPRRGLPPDSSGWLPSWAGSQLRSSFDDVRSASGCGKRSVLVEKRMWLTRSKSSPVRMSSHGSVTRPGSPNANGFGDWPLLAIEQCCPDCTMADVLQFGAGSLEGELEREKVEGIALRSARHTT